MVKRIIETFKGLNGGLILYGEIGPGVPKERRKYAQSPT